MRNNLTRYPVCCCTNVAALRLATPGSVAPVVTAPNTSPNTDTSTSSLRMASSSNSDDVTTGSTRVPRSLSASTRTFLDRSRQRRQSSPQTLQSRSTSHLETLQRGVSCRPNQSWQANQSSQANASWQAKPSRQIKPSCRLRQNMSRSRVCATPPTYYFNDDD
jgi:hypothetical protein